MMLRLLPLLRVALNLGWFPGGVLLQQPYVVDICMVCVGTCRWSRKPYVSDADPHLVEVSRHLVHCLRNSAAGSKNILRPPQFSEVLHGTGVP
jgi:hypothetical protein